MPDLTNTCVCCACVGLALPSRCGSVCMFVFSSVFAWWVFETAICVSVRFVAVRRSPPCLSRPTATTAGRLRRTSSTRASTPASPRPPCAIDPPSSRPPPGALASRAAFFLSQSSPLRTAKCAPPRKHNSGQKWQQLRPILEWLLLFPPAPCRLC